MARKKDNKNEGNPENNAILYGIESLREKYCLDMSPEILMNYLDKEKISSMLDDLYESEDFAELKTKKAKEKFLYGKIIKYIVEKKPFDEKGQKLLGSSLESIVGKEGFFKKVFSRNNSRGRNLKKVGEYAKARRTANEISHIVRKNYEFYKTKSPDLVKAVGDFGEVSGKSEIAEVLYASDRIDKGLYQKIKGSIGNYSQRILDLAEVYVTNPMASYATAAVGLGLLFFFNPMNLSGAVIGISGKSSGLFLVGIGLLMISVTGFFLQKKDIN